MADETAKTKPTGGRRAMSSDELRTFLAGQRTLLAWIRTAVALMGFGFLTAKFGLFLRQVAALEQFSELWASGFTLWMGTALVLLGVVVNVFAAYRHAEFTRQFETIEFGRPGAWRFEIGLSITLAVFGLVMAVYLLLVGP